MNEMWLGVSTGFSGSRHNKQRYVKIAVEVFRPDGFTWLYTMRVHPKTGTIQFDVAWMQSKLDPWPPFCPPDRVFSFCLTVDAKGPSPRACINWHFTPPAGEIPEGEPPWNRRRARWAAVERPNVNWAEFVELCRRAPYHDVKLMVLGWMEDNLPGDWAKLATPQAREFFQTLLPIPIWEKL